MSDSTFVWTIQPEEVWLKLQDQGHLSVDSALVSVHDNQTWLYEQLTRKFPGLLTHLPPWWFYCKKPDLRTFRHRKQLGSKHFRLKIRVPEKKMIFIPSRMWDAVLFGFGIPDNFDEIEWDLFAEELGERLDPEQDQLTNSRIIKSWGQLIERASISLDQRTAGDWEGLKSSLVLEEVVEAKAFFGSMNDSSIS